MPCNKTGRAGLTEEEKYLSLQRLKSVWPNNNDPPDFVGSGEPAIFEARLKLEGIDTDEVARISWQEGPTIDEMEHMLEDFEEMLAAIVDKRAMYCND